MGNKVKMSEVHDLKDSISKSLQSLSSNTNTLKTKMNDLKSNNNFKGQTAESINSYNDSFHIETINRIEKIKEEPKLLYEIEEFARNNNMRRISPYYHIINEIDEMTWVDVKVKVLEVLNT